MEPASPAPATNSAQAKPATDPDTTAEPGEGVESVAADGDGGVAHDAPSPRLAGGEERRPRDMVLSLAVLLVPIALLLIFYRVVLSGDAPITVDPGATLQEARQAAVFTVMEPQGLSSDWHVSTATFSRQAAGATLRIGYVDPDKDPVQLVQSSVPAATLLPGELGGEAKAQGNFRTPAGVWRLYDARPGEKALVLAETTRTIVIVGKTDVTNLETLAAALK